MHSNFSFILWLVRFGNAGAEESFDFTLHDGFSGDEESVEGGGGHGVRRTHFFKYWIGALRSGKVDGRKLNVESGRDASNQQSS